MFAHLKQLKKRLHNLQRLRSKSFRRELEGILALYPKGSTKPLEEILSDLSQLIWRDQIGNVRRELLHYLKSGMQLRGSDPTLYASYPSWGAVISASYQSAPEALALLDDKIQSNRFLAAHGFRVPQQLAELNPGEAASVLPPLLESCATVFCKPHDLCRGAGCMKLSLSERSGGCLADGLFRTWEELEQELFQVRDDEGKLASLYLLEECVQQHDILASFHPASLNTLRLWTLRRPDGTPEYLRGVIRIGTGGACIDNASAGGFFVGLEDDGSLMEQGHSFRHDAPIPMLCHPDTGVVFKGTRLPFFEEAKNMLCAAHHLLPRPLCALAWDVAITPVGPIIIEVNAQGGITTMQRAHGGWQAIFRERLLPSIHSNSPQTH